MAKCFSCGKTGCDNDGDLCRGCHNIVCTTCAKKYTHWLGGEHGRRPKKQNVTTIVVDKIFDVGESNAIMIGEEVLKILPIDSKEGQLFQFVDKKKKKGALLRVKRHLIPHADDPLNPVRKI